MPKPHTFPTLYNEVLQIHVSNLKAWGYLKPEQIKSGTINWSRGGNPTGSISINANTHSEQPYIELDYKSNGEPRKYKVLLTSTPSNLKKGAIWYFLCPQTKKRCRKLYLIGGYFLHREAFKSCMYESQTFSKKIRSLNNQFGLYFDLENNFEQLYSKHFKKFYNGKPTKKYLRLMNRIDKGEKLSGLNIEALLLMK